MERGTSGERRPERLAARPVAAPLGQPQGLGCPWWRIIGLAALAVPRVVAHDLQLAPPGGTVNRLLVFVPPLIWLVVVLGRRAPRPFLTLLLIGVCYGALLAIGHQLLWTASFGDTPPRLGGDLEGRLAPAAEALVLRVAAFASSLLTGTVVGAIVGLIGAGLSRLQRLATRA